MAKAEPPVWGIHGGETGDADALFLRHRVIALGWSRIDDLSGLPADRDAFKARVSQAYPEDRAGAVPVNAGQLFRFVHEMGVDDVVVYPSKVDKQIHIARVRGAYHYSQKWVQPYGHRREVEWLASAPRTSFTQGALHEIGSGMSLFRIRRYAGEFLAVMEGRVPPLVDVEDETVSLVAEDIAQNTRDFIAKRLAAELKGHPFAEFVAHLLNAIGYRTRVSPPGPDRGIDILAHRDELGIEPPIIKVQVKSTEGAVGDPETSALYGKVAGDEYGLIVTLGTFTRQARDFADGKQNLRLLDGDEIVDLVLLHYEELDSRYKGLIPLKHVYVPQRLEESEE
ncbi:MAG: restriction endonuclease [Armatimonadota bacterium]|jgi:restriction system protein